MSDITDPADKLAAQQLAREAAEAEVKRLRAVLHISEIADPVERQARNTASANAATQAGIQDVLQRVRDNATETLRRSCRFLRSRSQMQSLKSNEGELDERCAVVHGAGRLLGG
jgi:hypothetical protein